MQKRFIRQSICAKVAVFQIITIFACFIPKCIKMNFRKIIITTTLILGVIACKKEDEDTINPGLDGYLTIKGLPEFVAPGESVTLTPTGVSHPDGEAISYTWRVLPSKPETFSGETFNFTFTDTLQTCTIYCSAAAEGYTSSSASNYVTVVKGGKDGSIKGIDFPSSSFDTEDATYYYKQIGAQTWLVNNVAERDWGKAYRNTDVMSDVLGRYYSFEEAVIACQSLSTSEMTWALPTKEDWEEMAAYVKEQITADSSLGKTVASSLMANATFNTNQMWKYRPAVGDITNASGLSAIPAGYSNLMTSSFAGVYEYATFWTNSAEGTEANVAYLILDQPNINFQKLDKESFGASVRCIRK